MSLITFDNVLENPKDYVSDIHLHEFQDVADGQHVFRNIQPRGDSDDFAKFVSKLFPDYRLELNFVRKSPLNQQEPNFIHSDEMMGDLTCILYLNEESPSEDGTTIYDEEKKPLIKDDEGELAADRLKNAAATKKLAIFDAFEILNRIESEKENLDSIDKGISRTETKQGFAERRSKQ